MLANWSLLGRIITACKNAAVEKQVISVFVVISVLLFQVQIVFSQTINTENYVITQYGMQDGLPQSTVNDIIQTKDGYIWLATFGGLVRFDGVDFTTYNRSNTEGMNSDRILHLFEDSNGAIWMGTEEGFLRFKDESCTLYPIKENSFVYSPSMVKEDSDGRIWLVAAGKVFKINGKTVEGVSVSDDPELIQKAKQNKDGVFLAHENVVLKTYEDQVVQILDLSSELQNAIIDFVELPKNSGEYFIGTTGDGVFHYKNGDLNLYTSEHGLQSRYTWNFYVDSKETLWVTSYLGISHWTGSKFTPLTLEESSKGTQLNRVLEDKDGNIWIGSLGDGLFKLRPAEINTIGLEDGLKNDQMLSLSTLADGSYIFATNCGGVYTYDPTSEKLIQPYISSQLPNQCIWSVFEDSKGNIWFGSRLLYRTTSLDKLGQTIGKEDGFEGIDIFTISEDSKGNIWIGALNGLYKFDGESYRRYSTEDGLSYNDTRTVFEDRDSVLWIGTSNGLNRIVNGNIEQVTLDDFSQPGTIKDEPYVRAIHQDNEGVIWIGTYGDGMYRIKDDEIFSFKKKDGLFDNIVSHVVEDDYGNFWMGSNQGIYRISKDQLNKYAEGTIPRLAGFVYGVNDGMLSAETNGGFEPNVIQSKDGKLYFPTVSGVAVVSTKAIAEDRTPPKVYIEKVRNGNVRLPKDKHVQLNYDNAFLQIDYTGLSFKDPDKVTFRYQLVGLNENWFEVGQDRSALFTKIPPGEYTFKVEASSNNGPWSTENASLGITVIPPFWQTSWFYALVIMVFISIGPTIYYVRITKLKRDNERQKRFTQQLIDSQESERRRIASELHDGLGQQILIMKNRAEMAMQHISDPVEIKNQLNEIMESAKISIGDVRHISHGLRPVHLENFGLTESLGNLCSQLQKTCKLEWSYHIDNIDDCVQKDKEINLYRVLQEATNNIQKHAEATEASVMVLRKNSDIRIVIWDDGKGFNTEDRSLMEGLGFTGMSERIQSLGGTLTINSKTGEGTTIKIKIPVN
ncbi:MAG: two-component regulator propeller domain-containing protein [Gracilimonas sp.]|nr:two-component regulator propeller domain-containing protein [Gracilimonas sp.]